MKFRTISILMLLLAMIAVACSAQEAQAGPASLTSADDLMAALETKGVSTTKGEQIEQAFFTIPAVLLNTAESGFQVFEYADQAAAQADSALVAADGSSVGTSMPFWVDEPHFFQSGSLIVLYLGSDASTLAALEAVLGPQFAGR